ncbi:hypothetical protein DFH09DRAFT_1367500 [Mycena vulgaris]|nr:hypothetical protein DFH09DRAFT_1367500 [Mycena vulgaris]
MPPRSIEILEDSSRLSEHLRDAQGPGSRASGTVALFCGLEYEDTHNWDERRPGTPHFLPSAATSIPARERRKKSTGCGAPVHSGATVSRTWRAPAAGTSLNVIPLDAEYFAPNIAKLLKLGLCGPCGCKMEGVGCRVCGNALGSKFNICPLHSRPTHLARLYTFLPTAVSPPLPFNAASAPRIAAAAAPGMPFLLPIQDARRLEATTPTEILRAMRAIHDAGDAATDLPAIFVAQRVFLDAERGREGESLESTMRADQRVAEQRMVSQISTPGSWRRTYQTSVPGLGFVDDPLDREPATFLDRAIVEARRLAPTELRFLDGAEWTAAVAGAESGTSGTAVQNQEQRSPRTRESPPLSADLYIGL